MHVRHPAAAEERADEIVPDVHGHSAARARTTTHTSQNVRRSEGLVRFHWCFRQYAAGRLCAHKKAFRVSHTVKVRCLYALGRQCALCGTIKFLFQTLAAPAVRGVARGSRVIIVPDGALHRLNFETLVVPTPRPHWWIEDVIVTSANALHLLGRPAAKRTAEPALLLVGNAPRADPAFAPLPNAGQEMQLVGAQFPRRTVLSGASATPKAFLRAAPASYDVIHFVAHGIATRRRPLDSAVILALDDTEHYKLFARDVVDQHLTARLVTISSCQGAGTRAYAGEGLVGLAWAFLRAGAEHVIAALWDVDDAATTKLMNRMYEQIRLGRDPAVALRAAKLALIQSGTSQQKPRYWAPFVIYAGS
jgi:CHAT domain-containing protein